MIFKRLLNHTQDSLQCRRDAIRRQLDEAHELKRCVDARGLQLVSTLQTGLDETEMQNYRLFVDMKPRLVADARHLRDKVALGEEQVRHLRLSLDTMAS